MPECYNEFKHKYEGEIADIGFIHLDVEGMEEKVVQGAKRIIQKNRPIVAYEIHLELFQPNRYYLKQKF